MINDADLADDVTLDVPLDWDTRRPMAVAHDLVHDPIRVLCAHAASFWWPEAVSAKEARGYFQLMSATTAVLAGLFDAEAARQKRCGARQLVLMVQHFLDSPHASDHLDAIRGAWSDVDSEVTDALKALHWQIQKRRMEQTANERRGQAASDGSAASVP
jgi:hypothetical protein